MLDKIDQNQSVLLIIAVVVMTLVVLLFIRWMNKDKFKKKTRRIIKKISCDYLSDISLDLGEEQYAFFDYVLLYKQGIMAVETRDYSGHIFASDKINEWTQIIDRKSYKFDNPFFSMEHNIELLKRVIPDQSITGVILFNDLADFPKGRPDNVMRINELYKHHGKANANDAAADVMSNWNQLKKYLLNQADKS